MVVVSICGNIGSGKSTLIRKLNQHGLSVHEEPVAEMEELLTCFYKDVKKWAFHLQVKVLILYHQLKNKLTGSVEVIERSPLESKIVFAQSLYKSSLLDNVEYELYKELYSVMGWKPDFLIYLKTDPITCYKRIQIRNRSCEVDITQSYLEDLHTFYEELASSIPTCTIDANEDPDTVFRNVLAQLNLHIY